MGDSRGAKAPADIAQSIIGAGKPPYNDKVMDHMEEKINQIKWQTCIGTIYNKNGDLTA